MTDVAAGTVVVGMVDGGTWSACFGLSYRNLVLHDAFGPQRIVRPSGTDIRVEAGAMGVAAGRNEICGRFLDRTDGEWLLMVDTDMGFPADVADRLVKSADPELRPVVGALCFGLKREPLGPHYANRYRIQPMVWQYLELDNEVGFTPILDYPRDQVVEASGTGAACLLIHRDVLAAIRERSGDTWFEPLTHPTGDHGKPRHFGEDLSFCVRLAGVGAPLHIDTSVKTTHDKGGIFLDEETYDAQRVREST